MTEKRLTAEQLLESIERGTDDSASDSDDSIELRLETSDEEEKDVENYEEKTISDEFIFPTARSASNLSRSQTVEMLDENVSSINLANVASVNVAPVNVAPVNVASVNLAFRGNLILGNQFFISPVN